MIGVIFGEKGTGKTKRLLELANISAKEAKGSVVFIDSDDSYMYDLSTAARFINVRNYGIRSSQTLAGFLAGVAAMDFDLEYIYIDGFVRITQDKLELLEDCFQQLKELSERHNLNIIMSINGSAEHLPAFLNGLVLHTT